MNNKANTKKRLEKVVKVEYLTTRPDLLRIVIYYFEAEEKNQEIDLSKINEINENNSRVVFAFYEERYGLCWVDYDRPEANQDTDKIKKLVEDSNFKDWEIFEKELWVEKSSGEQGIMWGKSDIELLKKLNPECCKLVNVGLDSIKEYSLKQLQSIKKQKEEGKNEDGESSFLPVIAILESWKLIKNRCSKCLKIEKSLQENIDKLEKEQEKKHYENK